MGHVWAFGQFALDDTLYSDCMGQWHAHCALNGLADGITRRPMLRLIRENLFETLH